MPDRPALDRYYEGERWQPTSCACCTKCWLIAQTHNPGRRGRCVYGGPFLGYYQVNPEDPTP